MKKYEILFNDHHTEIVDHETMENLVYELESFERDDVSQIHEYDESNPDEVGKTIWTEEEGLFVSYGELDSDDEDEDESGVDLEDYELERICDRFKEELKNWSYDSWMSSSSSEKEEIVQSVLDDEDFGMFMEEELYEVFEDWSSGVDETYFD
jgi:hypothetical protein